MHLRAIIYCLLPFEAWRLRVRMLVGMMNDSSSYSKAASPRSCGPLFRRFTARTIAIGFLSGKDAALNKRCRQRLVARCNTQERAPQEGPCLLQGFEKLFRVRNVIFQCPAGEKDRKSTVDSTRVGQLVRRRFQSRFV